jgi:hypothetical protein
MTLKSELRILRNLLVRRSVLPIFLSWQVVLILNLIATATFSVVAWAKPKARPDVKVVSNPKMPRPPDGRAIDLVFTEDLSIGVHEGDENYLLGNRVYLNTDDEGDFFVTDWDRKTIRKYDPSGRYILSIGRSGQGPGEFVNVWRPEFDRNGDLYILDYPQYRISFFNREGKFLRQIMIPSDMQPTLITGKGFFVGSRSILEDTPVGSQYTEIYGVFDDKSRPITEFKRTVFAPKRSGDRSQDGMAEYLANMLSDLAFKPTVHYILGPDDRVYFGCPESYEIFIYDSAGKLGRLIRREYDESPVRDSDKKQFIDNDVIPNWLIKPSLAPIKDKVIKGIRFPKAKPAYSSFALMENGWLAVVVETATDGETVFDLFDKDGVYIAHFQAPIPSDGLFFKNGKAYAIKTDDGFKSVKRYRFEIRKQP